jgi:hypothetical protein
MSLQMIEVDAGRALVLHRLALAVLPVDAITEAPVSFGVRVGLETVRSLDKAKRPPRRLWRPMPTPHLPLRGGYGAAYVLRHSPLDNLHGAGGGQPRPPAVIRIEDPAGRWIPRRISVPLWTLADAQASDRVVDPSGQVSGPTGPFVLPVARSVSPWLLPAPGYQPPETTTGLRLRVMRGGQPVRWPRVEAFTATGRLGWAHGDQHGDVLLLASERAAFPPPGTGNLPIALRVSSRDPAVKLSDEIQDLLKAGDELADLALEPFPRPPNVTPPAPPSTLAQGLDVPAEYVTAPDVGDAIQPGRITRILPDLVVP